MKFHIRKSFKMLPSGASFALFWPIDIIILTMTPNIENVLLYVRQHPNMGYRAVNIAELAVANTEDK
jgi:zona occludens toxin (predicted ATPase)